MTSLEKLKNQRLLELERREKAYEKRKNMTYSRVEINSYTKIFPKNKPDRKLTEEEIKCAKETFVSGWKKSQEHHAKHADPFLSK